MSAISLGRRLFFLGSARPGRWPTRSLLEAACPRADNSAVTPITAHNNQVVANICRVAVKLKLRGSRPLLVQDCSIFSRIRLYANRQDHNSV